MVTYFTLMFNFSYLNFKQINHSLNPLGIRFAAQKNLPVCKYNSKVKIIRGIRSVRRDARVYDGRMGAASWMKYQFVWRLQVQAFPVGPKHINCTFAENKRQTNFVNMKKNNRCDYFKLDQGILGIGVVCRTCLFILHKLKIRKGWG